MNTTELMNSVQQSADTAERSRSNGAHGGRAAASAAVRPRHLWYRPIKFVAEYLVAVVLTIIALPIICVAAMLIKITSPGPVFYLQTRLGRRGRVFRVIKLRTMIHNAEAKTGPVWAGENDARITPIGRFLRDTHIDEFPQLINVLLGQMALIGPRPERPEIVLDIEWKIDNYRDRLQVRPGITGLAQMNLPPDSDLDSVRRKLRHDLYYIRWRSPWLDLKIFCATGWLLFKTLIRGVAGVFALPNGDKVDRQVQRMVGPESDLVTASAGKRD